MAFRGTASGRPGRSPEAHESLVNRLTLAEVPLTGLSSGKPQMRLVVDRCDEAEIASRLLRLGEDFTVVSLPSLIEKVKATAAAITERHS